jgi:CDP-diacylglycerol--glycerol-3-phosphate 3-phosphatidyltransferase
LLTLPNAITVLRLALLPAFLWLTYSHQAGIVIVAWALFNGAAASDWVDGYLARRCGAVSALGTLLDPVVDKIVVLSALLVFVDLGLLPLWLVLLNLAREFLVTSARQIHSTPEHVVGANWMGKVKFAAQVAVIEAGYLLLVLRSAGHPVPWAQGALFWAALGMTLVSWFFLVNFLRWHGLRPDVEGAESERPDK